MGQDYQPYIEGSGRFFDFLNGGGATLWFPFKGNNRDLFFGQAHGGYYRGFLTKWSLGGGYRHLWRSELGIGANAFFDFGHGGPGRNFYQGGVGLEAFGPCYVARINGYFPRLRNIRLDNRAALIGTSVVPNNLFEVPYMGMDTEVGYGLPVCYGEVWAYAGYYYYNAPRVPTIQGPRLRGEYSLYGGGTGGPQFTVGGEWRYDRVHKSAGSLILRLRLPLGRPQWRIRLGTCVPRIRRRMTDPVRRELNIWVEKLRILEKDNTLANLYFFAQVGAAASGTQSGPTTLLDAQSRSGPGDILFAINSSGDITGDVVLKDGQQLAGFGDGNSQTLFVGGNVLTVPKTSTGGRGTLAGIAGTTLATNNVVKGIGFSSGTQYLVGMDFVGLLIQDVVAAGQVGALPAVALSGTGGVTVFSSNIASTANAVELSSLTGAVLVSSNTISGGAGPLNQAVAFVNTVNATALVINNTLNSSGSGDRIGITNTAGSGTLLATATANTSTGIAFGQMSVISITGGSPTVTYVFDGNIVSGASGTPITSGVTAAGATLNQAIRNNTITSAASTLAAIFIDTAAGTQNIRIQNNAISNHTGGVNGDAILMGSFTAGTGTITSFVDSNTATNCTRVVRIGEIAGGASSGTVNHTVTNNQGVSMLATDSSYEVFPQTSARTTCITLQNNNSDTAFATPIDIGAPMAGTVAIFPSAVPATLSAANNGLASTVGAGVTTAPTPCPLPPAIP